MRYFILFILFIGPSMHAFATENNKRTTDKDNGYFFDPSLFKGGDFDQSALEKLIQPDAIAPGSYKVDVYVNKTFIGNKLIDFVTENNKTLPCFSTKLINDIGFKNTKNITNNSEKGNDSN